MDATERYFDGLYSDDDPYGYRQRWYEERKRALLLASLPRAHFGSAWEWGCSNGELTAGLAARCDSLWATDLSARAVALATRRVAGCANVVVAQARHPQQWPAGRFDLIVFSEVGYFLTADELRASVPRLVATLSAHGVLIACHWRYPFAEAACDVALVHETLHDGLRLPRLFAYSDEDFLLEGWSAAGVSVATQDGLR